MLLFTAGLAGLAVSPGLAGLLSAGFFLGLANGGIDIGANALIVELNRERTASALNYLHVLFGVGALLGPLIVSAAFASARVLLVGIRRRRDSVCRDRISFSHDASARRSHASGARQRKPKMDFYRCLRARSYGRSAP